MPPRVRPRRGAWRGSRSARAGVAACLATVAVLLSLPAPASAFPCGEAPRPPVQQRQLSSVQQTADECTTPGNRPRPKRERKKGNVGGLTVFVLAIAGALLIPIGRNGIPRTVDPYGHDRPF
jgi:hypothetical protein